MEEDVIFGDFCHGDVTRLPSYNINISIWSEGALTAAITPSTLLFLPTSPRVRVQLIGITNPAEVHPSSYTHINGCSLPQFVNRTQTNGCNIPVLNFSVDIDIWILRV